MRKIIVLLVLFVVVLSCKTYTVTPESFKTQFSGTSSDNLKKAEINNPLNPFKTIKYSANQLNSIVVLDKKGQQVKLENSPALETRVTLKNGKKYHFYFDTLVLENDSISGGRSRFVQSLTRKIPFDSIQRIEIQDGGKKYSYQ